MGIPKTRVATSANMKSKKNAAMMRSTNKESSNGTPSNILLARGLSARYCGASVPLSGLTSDEMERDLRHMEAFSNACIAYAQQYYIYQNSSTVTAQQTADDEKNGKKKASTAGAAAAAASTPAPIIAMPVRIDPEEEKRMANLRLKIQQCEAQREVLESQYLSLRAHYVYMSQRLKNTRKSVNGRIEFLQDMVKKRGQLVALQRARLQISREVLASLHYRQSGGKPRNEDSVSSTDGSTGDLVDLWNKIDDQFKQIEDSCRGEGTETWTALKVPKIPPGVPLLLSQLAKPPGFAAAWSTSGMFGSKKDSMCWLEHDFPEPAHRTKSLSALREEVDFLKQELDREHGMNRDLQSKIASRRKANVELAAMMALLRTETEAVVARHNILLESDLAKDAAMKLQMHQDEEPPSRQTTPAGDDNDTNKEEDEEDGQVAEEATPQKVADEPLAAPLTSAADPPLGAEADADADADAGVNAADADAAPTAIAATKTTTQDEANDGDDEGEAGDDDDEDDGEILEGGAEKRSLEEGESDGSSNKRRKL